MTPSDRFLQLAATLGGISQRALDHFFYWHNPVDLQNWTLNVVEVLMIGAAGLALGHAVAIRRRTGDRSYLGVWVAAAVYCIAMEVPIYFTPGLLGLDDGAVIFIHNEFTTGAFFGRMPLYILALYPALLYPAYVLVRQRGLFEGRWGLLRGAVCVGVVHHCLYEVFDQLGPQLKWWLWDYQLPTIGEVTLDSVPLSSLVNFSLINPIAFAMVAHALLRRARDSHSRTTGVAVASVLAGVLTPTVAIVLSPNLVYARIAEAPNRAVFSGLSYGMLAIAVLFTLWAMWQTRVAPLLLDGATGFAARYVPSVIIAYLAVFLVLWTVSLPTYLHATSGITEEGTPTGSVVYATVSALACLWFIWPYRHALTSQGSADHRAVTSAQ